jgi:hypothetical protein
MSSDRVVVNRNFECDPRDFAVAANTVIAKRFGADAIEGIKRHWYSKRAPLAVQAVKVDCATTEQIVTGGFEVRGFPGRVWLNLEHIVMTAEVATEDRAKAERLLTAVHDQIKHRSIYRGKAITAGLEFMDLSKIPLDGLTYNDDLERELRAHVWTLIEEAAACQKAGIKLQRKVLFSGPYGCGKTLTALLTARKAVEHEWTFLYVDPSLSAMRTVAFALDFAQKYQPAVVLIEDFDREQRESNPFALGHLMASIDGAMSKASELMVILTTNHPDKIAAGLQRPGRIDRIIDFGRFTPDDVGRLLKSAIPETFLDAGIDWYTVGKACDGYAPAFVYEVGNSVKLAAISQDRANPRVTQQMLITAASALRRQHKVCTQESLGFSTGKGSE